LKTKDPTKWAELVELNKPTPEDDYSAAVVRYAERWADMLETAMELANLDDASFAAVAKSTSHEADTEGISGAMYGMAVQILRDHWEHGERLNRWHNAKYGVKDDSGTVNPAIVTVG